METLRQLVRNRALLTFMLGHFTVDMYSGLLPVLYPLMALRFTLSKEDIGLVALAFTAASSLSQPIFGYVADRFGSRVLAPASLAWAAIIFGLTGFSPSRGMLMLAAAMAGLGSGAYHPLGASNASIATGEGQKNAAMSLYTVGGSAGFALGPLLGAGIFGLLGGQGTLALAPFGLISAALVVRSLSRLQLGLPTRARAAVDAVVEPIRWRALAPVIGVTMFRSWASLSMITFIPVWYQDLGYGPGFYGPLTTIVIGAGAVGTLFGGILADRIGQRRVLLGSLGLAVPALLLFVGVPGPIALLTGVLFGLAADASLAVTLVMAQRLLPGRVGMASGFILGLGFVTGGIGVPITGRLADRYGTQPALMLLSLLFLAAIACATLLRWEDRPKDAAAYRPATARSDD